MIVSRIPSFIQHDSTSRNGVSCDIIGSVNRGSKSTRKRIGHHDRIIIGVFTPSEIDLGCANRGSSKIGRIILRRTGYETKVDLLSSGILSNINQRF